MATLNDIAKKIGTLAETYAPINKNPKAKNRGNLKRQIAKTNTPTNVLNKPSGDFNIKNRTTYGLEFTIDYAPDGATYGKFVEEGHKTRKQPGGKGKDYVQPNPFAEKAINDPQVDEMIMQYLDELTNKIATQVGDAIDNELS